MLLHPIKMAEVLSQICSLSSQLHYSNDIADQDYDNQTHDLLVQLKQIITTASDIISGESDFLDVSKVWHLVESAFGRELMAESLGA